MIYRIGIEDIEPNHWVAWVFDLPGCFSAARSHDEALANVSRRIVEYSDWLASHGLGSVERTERMETEVTESFRSFPSEGDYFVNAFFEDDRRPLATDEIEYALRLLEFSRRDLLAVVQPLSDERLDRPVAGEVQGCIRGILHHIATAEWWYWDRLNLAFPREEMPDDTMAALEKGRLLTKTRLPEVAGDTRITFRRGEQWSARKVVRRALWHERAHTQQIQRYLSQGK
ncbi:MAG TPA: DinB family protein [Candidatus Deferrimicrobium sp.]|nr:DinB family protein [Candidatus Deferrimicrobium sp.]